MPTYPAVPESLMAASLRWGGAFSGYVTAGGFHGTSATTSVSVASLTAYATDEGALRGFAELQARTITYSAGDGTYWLAGRWTVALAPPSWTPVAGTHYVWQQATTRPTPPAGVVLLGQVTVSGGAITAFRDCAVRRMTGLDVVTAARTVDASAVWSIAPGGRVQVAAGIVLTLLGQIEAGRYPIFDLSAPGAQILLANGTPVFPEWWGARADDAFDSATALNQAVNAAPQGTKLVLGPGIYRVGSPLRPPQGGGGIAVMSWEIQGAVKRAGSILRRTAAFLGPILEISSSTATGSTNNGLLQDVTVDGIDQALGTVGIKSWRMADATWTNVVILNCDIGWHSAHNLVTMSLYNPTVERCRTGWYHDGQVGALSVVQIFGGRFRNNEVQSIWLDGDPSGARRLRTVMLIGTVVESQGITTGSNIGFRAHCAENLGFVGVHFEGNAPHVFLEGTGSLTPTRSVTFQNCNFGELNGAAPAGADGLLWTGDQYQGADSWMASCFVSQGTINIQHTGTMFEMRADVIGMASLAGRFIQRRPQGAVFEVLTRPDEVAPVWFLQRLAQLQDTYTVRREHRLQTRTTTDATPAVMTLFDATEIPLNSAALIQATVFARQEDNSSHGAYSVSGLFRNVAGVITQIGATQESFAAIESEAGMNATLDVAAGAARLVITGLADASPVRWAAEIILVLSLAP